VSFGLLQCRSRLKRFRDYRGDFRSPHFGHPEGTKVYVSHTSCSRYVQMIPPNPKLVDGVWVSRDGEMECTFYVRPNRRKIFKPLFERHAKGLGMSGPVEFLS